MAPSTWQDPLVRSAPDPNATLSLRQWSVNSSNLLNDEKSVVWWPSKESVQAPVCRAGTWESVYFVLHFPCRARLQDLAELFTAVAAFQCMCFFTKHEGWFRTPLNGPYCFICAKFMGLWSWEASIGSTNVSFVNIFNVCYVAPFFQICA